MVNLEKRNALKRLFIGFSIFALYIYTALNPSKVLERYLELHNGEERNGKEEDEGSVRVEGDTLIIGR